MAVTGLKAGTLIALFAGTAAMMLVAQDGAVRRADGDLGEQPRQPQSFWAPSMASTLATWKALQQTDSLPFRQLFVVPDGPTPAGRTRPPTARRPERQAGLGSASPGNVVAFFRRFPPLTGAGGVAYARALAAIGRMGEANEAARQAWRQGALSSTDEGTVLTQFGGALSPRDHDARFDALLWQGQTGAAARVLPARQPVGGFAVRGPARLPDQGADRV